MSKKGGFQELLYSTIMPKVYGIGAAVVIFGAMFKILHMPGAGLMLGVGYRLSEATAQEPHMRNEKRNAPPVRFE